MTNVAACMERVKEKFAHGVSCGDNSRGCDILFFKSIFLALPSHMSQCVKSKTK